MKTWNLAKNDGFRRWFKNVFLKEFKSDINNEHSFRLFFRFQCEHKKSPGWLQTGKNSPTLALWNIKRENIPWKILEASPTEQHHQKKKTTFLRLTFMASILPEANLNSVSDFPWQQRWCHVLVNAQSQAILDGFCTGNPRCCGTMITWCWDWDRLTSEKKNYKHVAGRIILTLVNI